MISDPKPQLSEIDRMHIWRILDFWFACGNDLSTAQYQRKWFMKNPVFDREIRVIFGELVEDAREDHLRHWEKTPESTLALLLLLDQFPRNIFRDSEDAFSSDGKAGEISHKAIRHKFDSGLPQMVRQFFYMPLMHSEELEDQEECVRLTKAHCSSNTHEFAVKHRDIIAEFGRFPHRNEILGRENTAEETKFLKRTGSSF